MPRVVEKRLTARRVETVKVPGRYADGDGLYLQVQRAADGGVVKSWFFRYMIKGKTFTGANSKKPGTPTSREMGLGPVRILSLAEAREKVREYRKLLLDKRDPMEVRDANFAEEIRKKQSAKSFEQCVDEYLATKEEEWKSTKHAKQWRATLKSCYASFGNKPVSAITRDDVLKILQPMWKTTTETAVRLRARIETILEYAATQKYRDKGINPAAWKDNLKFLLPSPNKLKTVNHHKALPFDKVHELVADLHEKQADSFGALALEFIILTAVRTNEGIGARWDEIEEGDRLWSIPALRMKMKEPHRVPLSPAALDVLKRAKALAKKENIKSEFVFPSNMRKRGDRPLSNMACLKTLERIGVREKATTHGFRSSFKDWASETTSFPPMVVEMALAHAIENPVEAAYRRGELLLKRRKLMEAWAAYVTRPVKKSNVTPIHAAKHQ